MGIYRSYKHGATIKTLANTVGVRKTFSSLVRKLGKTAIRIKHNRIQIANLKGVWSYKS